MLELELSCWITIEKCEWQKRVFFLGEKKIYRFFLHQLIIAHSGETLCMMIKNATIDLPVLTVRCFFFAPSFRKSTTENKRKFLTTLKMIKKNFSSQCGCCCCCDVAKLLLFLFLFHFFFFITILSLTLAPWWILNDLFFYLNAD